MITFLCANPFCGKEGKQKLRMYNKTTKRGGAHFCNPKCSAQLASATMKEFTNDKSIPAIGVDVVSFLNTKLRDAGKRSIKNTKKYRRNSIVSVDIRYLIMLWHKQGGRCKYSNVVLTTSRNADPLYQASMDKIDSNAGYIEGNIQFISIAMNRLKHTMTHEDMIKTIDIIRNGGPGWQRSPEAIS